MKAWILSFSTGFKNYLGSHSFSKGLRINMVSRLNADSPDVNFQHLLIICGWDCHGCRFHICLRKTRVSHCCRQNRRFHMDLNDFRSVRFIHNSPGHLSRLFEHAPFPEPFDPCGTCVRIDPFSPAPFRNGQSAGPAEPYQLQLFFRGATLCSHIRRLL